jgi:hypothetical protein
MSHISWNGIFRGVFVVDEHIGWLGNARFACHCRSFCVTIAITVVIRYVGARLVGCTVHVPGILYVGTGTCYVRRSLFRSNNSTVVYRF